MDHADPSAPPLAVKDPNFSVIDFVVTSSPRGAQVLGRGPTRCMTCGRELGYVFLTTAGPLGPECLTKLAGGQLSGRCVGPYRWLQRVFGGGLIIAAARIELASKDRLALFVDVAKQARPRPAPALAFDWSAAALVRCAVGLLIGEHDQRTGRSTPIIDMVPT